METVTVVKSRFDRMMRFLVYRDHPCFKGACKSYGEYSNNMQCPAFKTCGMRVLYDGTWVSNTKRECNGHLRRWVKGLD